MCIVQYDNPDPPSAEPEPTPKLKKRDIWLGVISLIASFAAFTLAVFHLISGWAARVSCASMRCALEYGEPILYWMSMSAVGGLALISASVFTLNVRALNRVRRDQFR